LTHPITSSPRKAKRGDSLGEDKDKNGTASGKNDSSDDLPSVGADASERESTTSMTPSKGSASVNPSTSAASNTDNWVVCCNESTYVPTSEDVGCIFLISVTAYSQRDDTVLYGPTQVFSEPVLSAPRMNNRRPMVPVPLQQGQQPVSPGTIKFRILSYNVLAELYATKQAYPYCDSWCLTWPYRRAMIMQEIEEQKGDIVCLQEVQMDHFEMHLQPFMHELGFDGLFKSKSRDAMGQYGKVDGCATFWKLAKFSMTENYTIEFNELARQAIAELGLDPQEERKYINRLMKDNVAQVVVLEVIPKHGVRPPRQLSHLCIVNTHLYSNVTRPDVKLWQTWMLMNELQQFAIQRDLALITCGDFNSEPESAVHELLTEGSLQRVHPELEEEGDDVRILPEQNDVYHSLDLASAMQTALGHEPLYTNYTRDWKGTLDYILFSPMRIRLMSVAALPTPQEIEMDSGEGLPSSVFPSDHLMLAVDVALSITGSGSIMTNHGRQNSNSNSSGSHSNSGYRGSKGVTMSGSSMMLGTGGAGKRPGMR
jgi:CCR4-NOT transcription complex subunit 6